MPSDPGPTLEKPHCSDRLPNERQQRAGCDGCPSEAFATLQKTLSAHGRHQNLSQPPAQKVSQNAPRRKPRPDRGAILDASGQGRCVPPLQGASELRHELELDAAARLAVRMPPSPALYPCRILIPRLVPQGAAGLQREKSH